MKTRTQKGSEKKRTQKGSEKKRGKGVLRGRRKQGKSVGSDMITRANTRHLTRILIVLQDCEFPLSYTQLLELTGINTSHLADGLHWLKCHNLVQEFHPRNKPSRLYGITHPKPPLEKLKLQTIHYPRPTDASNDS